MFELPFDRVAADFRSLGSVEALAGRALTGGVGAFLGFADGGVKGGRVAAWSAPRKSSDGERSYASWAGGPEAAMPPERGP